MKMLFCADVKLAAVCTEKLDVKLSQRWRKMRSEKFAELIDQASQNNAVYLMLFGQMFGQERLSESVIDGMFRAVKENASIQLIAFLNTEEYDRITYRSDVPENLHLFCLQKSDYYLDDSIAVRVNNGTVELQLGDNDTLVIRKNVASRYVIDGLSERVAIPSFEPTGYDDTLNAGFGYGVLDWSNDKLGQYVFKPWQKFSFRSAELKIIPSEDEKEITRKIGSAIRNIDRDSFLRLTLTGCSAFGIKINADALKAQLQSRVFYAEVFDNTSMDIDEEAFETDISLRSEFVRLALQDNSLSESERNRVISCGWNALNGKEVISE